MAEKELTDRCPLCDEDALVKTYDRDGVTFYIVDCKTCSRYHIRASLLTSISAGTHWEEMRAVLSKAARRWKSAYGRELVLGTQADIDHALVDQHRAEQTETPRTPPDRRPKVRPRTKTRPKRRGKTRS